MQPSASLFFTPLTPPPDNSPSDVAGDFLVHSSPLHFSSRLSVPADPLRSLAKSAALAFDHHSPVASTGLAAHSPVDQRTFRYTRDSLPSTHSVSAPSGGDQPIFSAPAALEHSSDAATLATSVPGYPCSPPPSRRHSEHGANSDKLSGASQFPTLSPAVSPADQAATSVPARLNLTAINSQTLPDHYHATFGSSVQPEQSEQHRHLTQAQQQQQQANSQVRTSPSSLHSPSDRFPPLASMLSSDRYPRVDRYAFPPPGHERRISDPSDHYPATKHYPHAMPMSSPAYGAPSYTLHRVGRSASYSDVGVEPAVSHADWQEEERYLDERARSAFDPYSPIHSTFSSSTSSIATQGLPSPHSAPYYHSHASRGYSGPTGSIYPSYGSSEDVSYDARPQSGSSDSNSPPYGYVQAPPPSGSRNQPATLAPHQADYASYAGGDPSSKTYSFVSLPGNTVRKRPRRRYDEIERLYSCNFPGCTKAYGTLNHLNAHVNMQKHGSKRHPNEFKEMRKQWRKMKKEQEMERERMSHLPNSGGNDVSEVMRRRRATDPNAYGLHAMNPEEGNVLPPGSVASSVSDPLGMSSLDVATYGLNSSLSMNVGSDPMGGMSVGSGYGQQHYTSPTGYQGGPRPPITPVSPTGPTDSFGRYTSNGSGLASLTESPTNYYGQPGEYEHERGRTPPPRNQLPPDATLCSAYSHSQHGDMGGDNYMLPSVSSGSRVDTRGHRSSQ